MLIVSLTLLPMKVRLISHEGLRFGMLEKNWQEMPDKHSLHLSL